MSLVVFASYPRAGVHWMIRMYMEVTGVKRWGRAGKPYIFDGVPVILKTHRLPGQVSLSMGSRDKIVYTYRHGKDAVLAHSKFLFKRDFYAGRLRESYSTEWLKRCIVGKERSAKRWQQHIEAFTSLTEENNCQVRLITFEDMLADPVKELRKVMRFVGIGDPKKATFEKISQFVAKAPNGEEIIMAPGRGLPYTGFLSGGEHLIHGPSTAEERLAVFTGRWRTFKYWTKEIDDLVNRQIGDTLEKLGYEL